MYFQFLELRHQVEIYNLTGRVAECPLDEMNRPRASVDPQLEKLLLPEPETVPQPSPAGGEQASAVARARPVAPRPRGGRSLPPR